jgi:hypothetical protein
VRARFTVAGLLGLVGGIGVAFAALKSPSPLWAWTFVGVALASLAASLVGAAFARGRRRAYWSGYAACGWPYFAAVFVPGLSEVIGPWLPTTPAIAALYRRIEPTPTLLFMDGEIVFKSYLEGRSSADRRPSWTRPDRTTGAVYSRAGVTTTPPRTFRFICHSILTMLFASLGGAFARRRYDLSRLDEASPAPSGTPREPGGAPAARRDLGGLVARYLHAKRGDAP